MYVGGGGLGMISLCESTALFGGLGVISLFSLPSPFSDDHVNFCATIFGRKGE